MSALDNASDLGILFPTLVVYYLILRQELKKQF